MLMRLDIEKSFVHFQAVVTALKKSSLNRGELAGHLALLMITLQGLLDNSDFKLVATPDMWESLADVMKALIGTLPAEVPALIQQHNDSVRDIEFSNQPEPGR